jgi:hypothetical protein
MTLTPFGGTKAKTPASSFAFGWIDVIVMRRVNPFALVVSN